MNENEKNITSIQAKKAKIRERYKGVDPDQLEIIPARRQTDVFDDEIYKRVAVYARVSTDDPRQTSSYELQKNYYTDMVSRHSNWDLVDIYADEGISGTSLKKRDHFNRMIADCKAGKIDLIVTKSVSRFARNIVDCISVVRMLSAMTPPVEVFFETEHINTLNDKTEMSLAFTATLAQEESHTKSTIMNASIEMRFSHGIFLTPPLLGYDRDEEGNLVINEDEAQTVRLIFFMYLYGYTCTQIAATLTQLGRTTKKGNTNWSAASILGVLKNERHCGDLVSRKTYTPSYLDHKSRKNRGERTQVRSRDHHEAIISRDDFIAVQRLISNAKYGNKGILPQLNVMKEGALRGFVSINPRWGAFTENDYFEASASAYTDDSSMESEIRPIEAQGGSFDLRGFEIARSQFFNTAGRLCVTITNDSVLFSTECIRKFGETMFVELLIHPSEHLLAVRPSTKETRNSVRWANLSEVGTYHPRIVRGAAFGKTLYGLFGWTDGCKYRVRGVYRQRDKEKLLVFDMRETEVFIPKAVLAPEVSEISEEVSFVDGVSESALDERRNVIAYPTAWATNFGTGFYRHAQARELATLEAKTAWKSMEEAQPYTEKMDIQVTAPEMVVQNIHQIISDMKQEVGGVDA